MYVKMKELGPIGGVHRACPLDPPMDCSNVFVVHHDLEPEPGHNDIVRVAKRFGVVLIS